MAVLAAIGATVSLALPSTHTGHKTWHLGVYDPGIHNVENGIYYEFCGHRYRRCGYGYEAWSVSRCESGHRPWAVNGQYLGLFQMGKHERARWGYGRDPWSQARGAFRYFVASGFGWGPWTCQP